MTDEEIDKEFMEWMRKFKIIKIPLTEEEWGYLRKGYLSLQVEIGFEMGITMTNKEIEKIKNRWKGCLAGRTSNPLSKRLKGCRIKEAK